MKKFLQTAQCRIDLSGGTLDLWPLYLYVGGLELVNMAINVSAKVEVNRSKRKKSEPQFEVKSLDLNAHRTYRTFEELQDSLLFSSSENPLRWINRVICDVYRNQKASDKISVVCSSQAPPGSGLGGSSVLGVALIQALLKSCGEHKAKGPEYLWKLQERVRNLEAIEIERPAGDQDYLPALFGGLNVIHLDSNLRKVEKLSPTVAKKIQKRIAILYTGKPHHSGINNWSIFKSFHDGDLKVKKTLLEISKVSKQLSAHLRKGKIDQLDSLLNQEWELRRTLSPLVDAPVLQESWTFAQKLGATARKGCGAAGGGCIFFYFPNEKLQKVALKTALPEKDWAWIEC